MNGFERVDNIIMLSFISLLKDPLAYLSATGIVVAGYGDRDYLFEYMNTDAAGSFLEKVLHEKEK